MMSEDVRVTTTNERRVLVVEDELMVAEVVERYLRRDGYLVRVVHDGHSALSESERFAPDLIVPDVMLPGIDGIEVCRLRERSAMPVIMLTARGEEVDKLVGLGIGADDYVTKPFSPRELVARVAAVLRRSDVRSGVDGDAIPRRRPAHQRANADRGGRPRHHPTHSP